MLLSRLQLVRNHCLMSLSKKQQVDMGEPFGHFWWSLKHPSPDYIISTRIVSGSCSIVGKPLCCHVSDLGFNSPWRSYHQISLPPHAARTTQLFILPRLVNEYWIILGVTVGHWWWGCSHQPPLVVWSTAKYLWSWVCRSHTYQLKLMEPQFRCA